MIKYIVALSILSLLVAGCGSAKPKAADARSTSEAAHAVLGDRLVAFFDSGGVVYVQFKARDAGSSKLIKNGILEDGRSVIQALYGSTKFAKPKKVTLEAMFEVKSQTGQLHDAVVGRMLYDIPDPVSWVNLPRLAQFEQLLSVANFPYN